VTKRQIIFSCIFLCVGIFSACKNKDTPVRQNLTFKEVNEIIRLSPKADTVYVDSTGHTWYVYVKEGGGLNIFPERDSTEAGGGAKRY
jgi:hypothetical protein